MFFPFKKTLVSLSLGLSVSFPSLSQDIHKNDVGDFNIGWSERSFWVSTNDSEYQLKLRSSQHPFQVALSSLSFYENQGSFWYDNSISVNCQQSIFTNSSFEGQSFLLSGTFIDCPQLNFYLRFSQTKEGHLRFALETNNPAYDLITLSIESDSKEKVFGMGQYAPADTLNLKGKMIPVIVQEGGIGRGRGLITGLVNRFSQGSGGNPLSSYYVAPYYFTSNNRSLMLENSELSVFDFSADSSISLSLFSKTMVGRILPGNSPKEIITSFTAYAGRMPPLPSWVQEGAIVALARPIDQSRDIIENLKENGVEIAGVWNQTWSGIARTYIGEQVLWNWVQSETDHPDWQEFVQDLEEQGIRTLCYINPMIRQVPEENKPVRRELMQEAIANSYLVKDSHGEVLVMPVTAFDVGLIDLTNPEARVWIKNIIKEEMVGNAGCSGWMADFAEALPFEAQMANGASGESFHNLYPVEWAKVNREAIEELGMLGEIFFFNRSGFTTSPRYSTSFWQGDQLTSWDSYDGIRNSLYGLLGGGLSGMAINHSDVGGYTSLSKLMLGIRRTPQILRRWTEMNAFTAILRTHEGNQPELNSQIYSNVDNMRHFAKFSKVYKALGFYRKELLAQAQATGVPLVRHMLLEFPDDMEAYEIQDQFLLGDKLLIAPVLNRCRFLLCNWVTKEVKLPKGEWVHLWSGESFSQDTWQTVTVPAPLGEPPVFYRKGTEFGKRFVKNLQDLGVL